MKNIFNKLAQKETPKEGFFHVERISNEHDHLLGQDTKDNIWSQDPSEEIEGECLDLINAFHNGMGCELLDYE